MSKKAIAKWVSIAVVALAILVWIRTVPSEDWEADFRRWIAGLGVWGPVVLCLIYITATLCLLPGSIITLAAGALFGLVGGFALVSVASTTGAGLAFLIARYVARDKVSEFAQSNAKFAAVDKAISEGGWKIVGLLRLSPAIPFTWQNYLYGLTQIHFWPYLLTTWVAMMPGTFMYAYLGSVASAASTSEGKPIWQWGLLVVGLLTTVTVAIYTAKLAQEKFREQTQSTQRSTGAQCSAAVECGDHHEV
ncbi:TVP38/TMEM64 family protein [Allorhodopirellula solitaria]|uniref:TVP38/TMEM64 family membrane protein n=1 Tax=Allorhodopirellula solitaria TaxID=2527987 RepID=A0A5C5XVM5_9BACT|nr:TVP38/TMEM64 family protein [Allorhodopirellula solitaria]TWT66045.1 TVP38/TMEM64 family inner membrane protein YdjZ [Allorhodopirellula solitaria]